ncbi:MAG: hypothetical protein EOO48_01995, partial [Flavobacterium sp.]
MKKILVLLAIGFSLAASAQTKPKQQAAPTNPKANIKVQQANSNPPKMTVQKQEAAPKKVVLYQVFTRLFGNK